MTTEIHPSIHLLYLLIHIWFAGTTETIKKKNTNKVLCLKNSTFFDIKHQQSGLLNVRLTG